MKFYKYYRDVKDILKTLNYQFSIKIELIPQTYNLEMDKMRNLLKDECEKLGWNYLDLTLYRDLTEDRRSDKSIPKGYRQFRFGYTLMSNTEIKSGKRYDLQHELIDISKLQWTTYNNTALKLEWEG
jgi:hypothetical protein